MSSDKSTKTLNKRLENAEQDTQQLMFQLEKMGFNMPSPSGKTENFDNQRSSLEITKNVNESANPKISDGADSVIKVTFNKKRSESGEEIDIVESNSKSSSTNYLSQKQNRSEKYKPLSPISLRGMLPTGKRVQSSQIGERRRKEEEITRKKDKDEAKTSIGRHELEQELIRVKRIASQLEDELMYETQAKDKAKEELEKLQTVLYDSDKLKAEFQMKVEEMSLVKAKLNRKAEEFKEEAEREGSLRSSLEESHATLLSRLRDMESVIESLRGEVRAHSSGNSDLKAEVLKLKNDLEIETVQRKEMEENYHRALSEKDALVIKLNTCQNENQIVSSEMTRLQGQYTELIQQLEESKDVLDALSTSKRGIEDEKEKLQTRLQSITKDFENLNKQHGETKECETRVLADKIALEEDYTRLQVDKQRLEADCQIKVKKIERLERDLQATQQSLTLKNQEFTSAADGLEIELSSLKNQLEAMEGEKQLVLKDKENLLEEVNHTVDTLMSERSRLQTELQASCVETESLRVTCSRLELGKAELLERLGGLQHQQSTQLKVEAALKDMVEQKNKLAYENGKLQSSLDQIQNELDHVTQEQGDIIQLRQLTQSLQTKYTKSQQDVSEFKIQVQRLEGQLRTALDDLDMKEKELSTCQECRKDAESQLGKLLCHVEALEGRQAYKTNNYQKSMKDAKSVNQEIACTLEAVMTSHGQLQNIVENLQIELGKRDSQISQLKSARHKDKEEKKQEIRVFEERIEHMKQEVKKEKENNSKKSSKDLLEVRKQGENLSSRNQELVKTNTELRQRVLEVEKEKEEMKSKMSGQKHKMEYLHRAKKQLEENLNRMKAVREDITELEEMRDEYVKKNKEQAETITTFMNQISDIQNEMRQLVQAYSSSQHLLKLKEEALEKERMIREEMKKKYSESHRREPEWNRKILNSDDKLIEAHNESMEISKHLQEAHDWFKGKFDKLQTEITASKNIQAKLDKDNKDQRKSLEDERAKAVETARRAKEMIQNSKQTISQLADYTEIADVETKEQIAKLQTGLTPDNRRNKLTIQDLRV